MNQVLPPSAKFLAAGLALACLASAARGQEFLGKSMQTWRADLGADDATKRRSAAFALGKIGKGAQEALDDLAQHLDDPDARVREAAAFAIGEICTAAKEGHGSALKALCKHLGDAKEEPLVRRSAAFAIGCMHQGDDPEVRAALKAALKDKDATVRQNVAWALGRTGDDAAPDLRLALKDDDPIVRRDAAKSVDLLSPDAARPAVPELVACCKSSDLELRKAAVIALVRLVNPADEAFQGTLGKLLEETDWDVKRNAALAVGQIGGPGAAKAVPILLKLLTGDDLPLKRQAALAFKNIGPAAKAAIPELRKALGSTDKGLRLNATVAFTGMKDVGEPAVPALAKMVEDKKEDVEVRKQAAVALSRIGFNPALQKAMPGVLRVIANPEEVGVVRERALFPVRVYLNYSDEKERASVLKKLEQVMGQPPRQDIRMLRYDCAYLLGYFLRANAPEKTFDVLSEFLKDTEIRIYVGGGGGGQGSGEGKTNTKTNFKERGEGDGRIMAVDALRLIGAEKTAARPDILLQLLKLEADPKTEPHVRAGLEELFVDPDMKEQLQALQRAATTPAELRAAIGRLLPRLPEMEKRVKSRPKSS
jgi:HEAT repeat protein